MPRVPTRQIVEAARMSGYGVAAFNVITLEHAEAVVSGAETAGVPVILQVSENAVAYHGGQVLPLAAAAAAIADVAGVDVSLHLDHVEDQQLLHLAAAAGFSSVMYDASKLDFADNVAATREAARWGHAHGLYVEAELGAVGGKGGAHTPGVRTDPGEAAQFVGDTEVDALAVAVGSSHAMTERTAALDFDLIAAIGEAVSVPLVLHGSSGVADADLRRAVRSGIVKVNIGTILNVAFTDAVRQSLGDPSLVDPRKYLAPARAGVADVVAHLAAVVSRPA
ncbi:MAG TPA: class II fructose-bisphosphate aldolase [Jatrophihabitans sp.]|jgi:fructose-bisphosphate aldolase class II|uniref:class II fructose-bisphosphate aldolase n=1 Tax=Jatrophihabitans sp. TaxID=1932789 RepID=UPI002F0E62C3